MASIAFASLRDGNIIEGWLGPWKITPTGMEIGYIAFAYESTTRQKTAGEVVVAVPDNTPLGNIRVLATTAIVDWAAAQGITVPRTSVFLPQFQQGL